MEWHSILNWRELDLIGRTKMGCIGVGKQAISSSYEGRIDGTPDDDTDLPSVFSIHLGKDQFYTEIQVDLPFSITEGQTRHFAVEWDLAKSQFNDSDMIDLSIPAESQFHGAELELAARFQALLQDAFLHTVD